ncbi:MAG: regulatory iron-sulfur-containing complex subunit RicT [Saprospiraceae bacterium]|nr:regulatory iron-sulfur-containing complex subunit RicT [Saprospiraceae bacterium]
MLDIADPSASDIVEVSFKSGARKDFCRCPAHLDVVTGDMVVIDEGNGFNMGRIGLSGDLVRLQMKKKRVDEDRVLHTVVRRANERDLERLAEARGREKAALVKSRAIARTLGLDMKIGDVEFRGDSRKATFYYTADGRVDFRELVRHYASEFRVKIEMRQIGARQESSRIGGLGACGRELCCSTWLTDFKSVTTAAARYQNLSINQTKLSGQCGRLKCCLNYELDTYMDALRDFPKNVDRLKMETGTVTLIKTDIFKRLMYYAYETERGRSNITAVHVDRVKEIKAMNAQGEFPLKLVPDDYGVTDDGSEAVSDFGAEVTGFIELPEEKRRRRSKRRGRKRKGGRGGSQNTPSGQGGNKSRGEQKQGKGGESSGGNQRSRRRGGRRRNKRSGGGGSGNPQQGNNTKKDG